MRACVRACVGEEGERGERGERGGERMKEEIQTISFQWWEHWARNCCIATEVSNEMCVCEIKNVYKNLDGKAKLGKETSWET